MMVFIIMSGLLAAASVRVEVFPEIPLDRISIQVPYLGAGPEEVEAGVVVRIEEAIQGIDGIRRIQSTASEGNASVMADLELGADARRVIDEVKNNIDAVTTFPAETEEPIIRELTARNQIVDVAIFGAADFFTLKTLAERLRDGLSALPEITLTEIVSAPRYEISIEVSEVALRRHGFTFDDVADAVRRSSLDLPGGSVRTDGGEILLRTIGQAYRGRDYQDLVLWTRPDGTRLRLGDVAAVVDGFADTDQHARFDGYPAVMVSVFRTGDQSALDIAAAVHRHVESAQAQLPAGISMVVWQDQAVLLDDRLALMRRNGIAGFVLVFAVLALFLELRLAFWVTLGIPVSFLGAVALMPGLDVSVNDISLFAFIVVLGIMVDDAVIVGENIRRHQERHGDGLRGSIEGAQEVAKPVIFAVLTTAAAFLPLMFVPGIVGRSLRVIPLVVIPCLLFSLVESLGILPAHLSHPSRRGAPGAWRRVQRRVAAGLAWLVRAAYRPLLDAALRWRYVTAASGVATLILAGGMVLGGWAAFRFLPPVEADFMTAAVRMPLGSPVDSTSAAVGRLEDGAARLRERLARETGMDYVRHVAATVGDQPMLARAGGPVGPLEALSASNVGEVTVELAPAGARVYTSEELGALWREMTAPIPEAVEVTFETSLIALGNDIDVQLSGPDLDRLRAAAAEIRTRLTEYAGVYEISDSFLAGKQELQIGIKPAAELFGLTLQDLGRQVRQAFYGEEAQRIQRGRDDVRVMVRYPRDDRRSLGALDDMRIRTPGGGEVPFRQVARVEPGRGFASIGRVDRNRTVHVTASVDPTVASAGAVIDELRTRLLPAVLAGHPGVSYSFQGIQAEQEDALGSLLRGFVLAMLAVFAMLAVPLRSYVQPVIILVAVPFGLVGAVWGHMAMGLDFTLMSVLGLVALSGVVIDDSLIMVAFINRARSRAGARSSDGRRVGAGDLRRAIGEAASARFRPILLTSLTTFFGLAPLMLERNIQAMFLVPMAVSLAFGGLFATIITLILVPAAYLIVDDLERVARSLFGRAA